MAYYQDGNYLTQETASDYDLTHEPGATVPLSGVYRCDGCGKSVTCIKERKFPPQGHHAHTAAQGKIRWRLVVRSHWIGGY